MLVGNVLRTTAIPYNALVLKLGYTLESPGKLEK